MVLLDESFNEPWKGPAKTGIIRLISTLISTSPSIYSRSNLLSQLSSSYKGSLSEGDRQILKLWHLVEQKCGVSMAQHALKWGSNQTTDPGRSVSATGDAVSASVDCLSSIDSNLMMQTIEWFEVDSAGYDPSSVDTFNQKKRVFSSKHGAHYDARFILPLVASSIILAGDRLDRKKLIESNALGLATMAMSSEDESIRKVGYFVMHHAMQTIEAAEDLKEKDQVILLLSAFKNGITVSNAQETPRIPTIVALFVAKSLNIMCKPDNLMYPLVNQFLLKRPFLDIGDVPMFYSLMNSGSDDCRRERVWLFRLLASGLRCAEVCLKFMDAL
jgi:hypothetical protein